MPFVGEQLTIGGQGRGVDEMLPDSGGATVLVELRLPGRFGVGADGLVVGATGSAARVCTGGVVIDGAPNPGINGMAGANVGPAEVSPAAGFGLKPGALVVGGTPAVAGLSTAEAVVGDGCRGAAPPDGCGAGPTGATVIGAGALIVALDDGVDGVAGTLWAVGAGAMGPVFGAGVAGRPGTLIEAGHIR
jgi:hypothetical protein